MAARLPALAAALPQPINPASTQSALWQAIVGEAAQPSAGPPARGSPVAGRCLATSGGAGCRGGSAPSHGPVRQTRSSDVSRCVTPGTQPESCVQGTSLQDGAPLGHSYSDGRGWQVSPPHLSDAATAPRTFLHAPQCLLGPAPAAPSPDCSAQARSGILGAWLGTTNHPPPSPCGRHRCAGIAAPHEASSHTCAAQPDG